MARDGISDPNAARNQQMIMQLEFMRMLVDDMGMTPQEAREALPNLMDTFHAWMRQRRAAAAPPAEQHQQEGGGRRKKVDRRRRRR
jgi:hypothetical protein